MRTFMIAGLIVAAGSSQPSLREQTKTPAETILYVAVNGNDAWSGTLPAPNAIGTDGPLASPIAARDVIRKMRAAGTCAGPVRVLLREGVFRTDGPIVLEPRDSGAWDAPVEYAAYPGERPLISGGRVIRGWQLDGNRWKAELPEVKAGAWRFSALWVNDQYRAPARTPNEGFLFTAGKAPALKDPTTGNDVDRSNTAFRFSPGDIQRWENLEDAVVVVMHSWDTSHHRIAAIDDENHIVTFTGPSGWAFEYWGPKQRYYVEHIFDALDRPGEWYLNRKTGVLYYWPMPGEDMTTAEVIAPVAAQLVIFQGDLDQGRFVDHVRLNGLRFAHTEFTLGPQGQACAQAAYPVHGAIHANGARYCSVEDCEITDISNYGIWFQLGCRHNRIVRNHIHEMGAGGVRLGDGGDPPSTHHVTEWNTVDNNWIHDGGKVFPAAVGVWIGRSSYNTVSHNEISDLFYTGISVGWSWGYAPSSAHHNTIEFNHIHHLGKWLLSDMGGIYTLGIAPGTTLRYNLIHDVFSYAYGGWGIYPDEGSTDLLIENNVVYNTKTGTFHQHYGKENRVRNNIFAFSHEGQIIRSREEEHRSFLFERNIVYFNNGRLLGSTWRNGNYWLDRNCYWDASGEEIEFSGLTFDEWRSKGHDLHSIIADPLFKNPKALDFRLKRNSPAIALGFRPIDTSKIGLYGCKKWVNAPKKIKREPSKLPEFPKPKPIVDGFEDTPVGDPPKGAAVQGATDRSGIRVTDGMAASGKRSLKIEDAAGLDHVWNPHMFYSPYFRAGAVEGSFDLLLEPGAVLIHEWRDDRSPYAVGPSLHFTGEGRLLVAGKELLHVPHGRWCHVAIRCLLGARATGTFDLELTLPSEPPRRFRSLPCGNSAFKTLAWFGLIANADAPVACHVDNVSLRVDRQRRR